MFYLKEVPPLSLESSGHRSGAGNVYLNPLLFALVAFIAMLI